MREKGTWKEEKGGYETEPPLKIFGERERESWFLPPYWNGILGATERVWVGTGESYTGFWVSGRVDVGKGHGREWIRSLLSEQKEKKKKKKYVRSLSWNLLKY